MTNDLTIQNHFFLCNIIGNQSMKYTLLHPCVPGITTATWLCHKTVTGRAAFDESSAPTACTGSKSCDNVISQYYRLSINRDTYTCNTILHKAKKLRSHIELSEATHISWRASYGCLSWVIWRNVVATYREHTECRALVLKRFAPMSQFPIGIQSDVKNLSSTL